MAEAKADDEALENIVAAEEATAKDDSIIKFNIGDQPIQSHQDPDVLYREQSIGKNYGRSFSQDTLGADIPKQRHVSATVQPNMYPKIKKSPSINSLSSMTKPKVQQGRNGMVLQLVLPNGMPNGGVSYEPNFAAPLQNGLKRRKPESVQGMSPQNSFVFNSGDFGSIKGPETIASEAISHVTPTPPEEKVRFTVSSVSIQYSLLYAMFLVSFGVTIYVVNVISEDYEVLKTVFSYYIVCVALLFILYIVLDVMVYMKKRKKYIDALEHNRANDIEFLENPEGGIHLSIPLPEASRLQKPLPHFYCLATGRHGGISMYLKIGAAVFCLGHIIHSGLVLGYQLVYLTSDYEMFEECTTVALLVLDFIYPFYAFLLLFFIFKYSNIIINRNIVLARFGFMHCMGSGLCFWVHTIIRETFDALAFYDGFGAGNDETQAETQVQTPNKTISDASSNIFPGKSVRMWTGICDGEAGMAIIYQNFSPYLYPFSVEFNILMVGILYLVWSNIANCKQSYEHNHQAADRARDCASDFEETPEKESNITIHVDCHSSSKGIFAGIAIFIILVVAIILFFVATNDERFEEMGTIINRATMLTVQAIMLIAVVWGFTYTAKLDVTTHSIPPLDDVLLYVAVPMFYLNFIFSMAASAYFGNGLYIAYLVVMTTQVVVQTSFIVDGLRRASNCRETRQKKPGREIVVFLVITNAAMWVTMTFEVTAYLHDDRYEFYGRVLWSILGHVWLPLMMFYRFHASACLADMWKYCYEKAGH